MSSHVVEARSHCLKMVAGFHPTCQAQLPAFSIIMPKTSGVEKFTSCKEHFVDGRLPHHEVGNGDGHEMKGVSGMAAAWGDSHG